MRNLQAVIFDLDGTLIDSEPLWARAEMNLAARYDVAWSEQDATDCFGLPLTVTTSRILQRGVPLSIDDAINEMLTDMEHAYSDGIPWKPGAFELLENLAQLEIPSALGTHSFQRLAKVVQRKSPEQALPVMVTGEELTQGKPDPEVFMTAAHRLRCEIQQTVVVEDSPPGAVAAEASGAAVAICPPNGATQNLKAYPHGPRTRFVPSLRHLTPELLESICNSNPVNPIRQTRVRRLG